MPIGHQFFLVLSIITLVLGNVVAIVQTNIKRMLAYSSIAHAGYALIGVVVAGKLGSAAASNGLASVMLYLAIYAFMTLGAFAIVGMLRKGTLEGDEIQDFTGLAKREPLAAFLMLVFLVSLAGIPPTAGFIGKLYIFMAAVHAGLDVAGRHCGHLRRRLRLLLSSNRDGDVYAGPRSLHHSRTQI